MNRQAVKTKSRSVFASITQMDFSNSHIPELSKKAKQTFPTFCIPSTFTSDGRQAKRYFGLADEKAKKYLGVQWEKLLFGGTF